MSDEFDFDAYYRVKDWGGIAWNPIAWNPICYEKMRDEDYEWTGIESENYDRVVMVMVGDDRRYTFDIDEVEKIDESEFCPECGQIGCKAYENE